MYYISESVMKASSSINKDNLLHCGTCLGKFSKSGKFRLHITALDYLAQYSKVRFLLILMTYSNVLIVYDSFADCLVSPLQMNQTKQ